MRLPRILAVLIPIAVPVLTARAQSNAEIIRGRIFGPDSVPLYQAEVLVTGLQTRATQIAKTDAKGVYTLVFANGEADYLVAVRKLGYISTTFRLSRTGISNLLGSDIYMKGAPRLLDTVIVDEKGQLLSSRDRTAIGEGGSNALVDSLFLADPDKLMALLLSIPGIIANDDSTFSFMGQSVDQNLTTLDGSKVRGATLPPDALGTTRVITSSADPARGGFAGANVAQTLKGGTDIFAATVRYSNANRVLAWDDPTVTRPMPRSNNTSGTANGPIIKGKLRYNFSWNVNDQSANWYSLLSPRQQLLSQNGIRMDSVRALTTTLQGLNIPLSYAAIPTDALNRNANTSSVIDWTPTATTSIRASYNMSYGSNVGGNSITAYPTQSNQTGYLAQNAAIRVTGYVHGLLDEFSMNGSNYSDHSNPYTQLPSARVRIGTEFDDGRTGLANLSFGGGSGRYYEHSPYFGATDELSWLPKSGKHKIKVGGSLEYNQSEYFYFPGNSLLGQYTYLTLADLAANKPASYERTLAVNPRNTRATSYSTWVGESWMKSKAFQMEGGLRFDFANPITRPRYNPTAEQVFGIRTDRIPDDVGMSPRLGFSWTSERRRGGGSGGPPSISGLSAQQIASLPPELVTSLLSMQRASTLPGIGVTGNIGAYTGSTSTSQIADLVDATGLPGTRINLSCVGATVPIPDWTTMTEGPTQCADGSAGSTFSIAKPVIRVFDPSYHAPASWRTSLSVDGIQVPGNFLLGFNGNFAYNIRGSSTVDLNMNRTPRFHLADDGRPVFADVSAVPASGAISSAASRISPDFATVSNVLSDLHGINEQLTATLAPVHPYFNTRVNVNLSYTLAGGRSESRGSSRIGTTGDPFEKEWVPTTQPRHNIRFNANGRVWWFNFGANTFLQSGVPLTPLVSGDINGDGNSNDDRAFIPDPATTPDTSLARQMNDLISHAPSGARQCLISQLGRMAGANSCHTPWQARVDLSASVTPPASWGYSDRLRLTMNVTNASGALVRAFGLENTPLGQSTLSTTPNPTLLYVTGFDSTNKRFNYRVNQLFGEPNNFGSLRRKYGPTQISLGAEYKFGGPPLNPIARGLGIREAFDKPPLTDEQRRVAVGRMKKDPTKPVVAMKDSLGLGPDQLAQLGSLSAEYNARADTALEPLTHWVLKKGKRIYDQDLQKQLTPAQSALSKLNAEYTKKAQALLTAPQLQRLTATQQGTPKKEK